MSWLFKKSFCDIRGEGNVCLVKKNGRILLRSNRERSRKNFGIVVDIFLRRFWYFNVFFWFCGWFLFFFLYSGKYFLCFFYYMGWFCKNKIWLRLIVSNRAC